MADGKVAEVAVGSHVLTGTLKPEGDGREPKAFSTVRVEDPDLVRELNEHGVNLSGVIESTFWRDVLSWILPVALFGVLVFLHSTTGTGAGRVMQVGQSKAKIYVEKDIKVTFADVAGVDEAKEELREVIEFLKTPEKFTSLVGRFPRGSCSSALPAPARRCWPVPWPARRG